jgi:hypothetical protein
MFVRPLKAKLQFLLTYSGGDANEERETAGSLPFASLEGRNDNQKSKNKGMASPLRGLILCPFSRAHVRRLKLSKDESGQLPSGTWCNCAKSR